MSRRLKRREVIAIRRLYDADFGYGEIAEAMNVPRQTVSNVVNLRTHKRVKDIPFTPIPSGSPGGAWGMPTGSRSVPQGEISHPIAPPIRPLSCATSRSRSPSGSWRELEYGRMVATSRAVVSWQRHWSRSFPKAT